MPRRIHMRDQVGANKVGEFMSHYDQCSMDLWTLKFMVIGTFLVLGIYW